MNHVRPLLRPVETPVHSHTGDGAGGVSSVAKMAGIDASSDPRLYRGNGAAVVQEARGGDVAGVSEGVTASKRVGARGFGGRRRAFHVPSCDGRRGCAGIRFVPARDRRGGRGMRARCPAGRWRRCDGCMRSWERQRACDGVFGKCI